MLVCNLRSRDQMTTSTSSFGDPTGHKSQLHEYRGSFVRWQAITIAQLGYAIGLILSLTTAAIGFAFGLIKDGAFRPGPCEKVGFSGGLLLLSVSFALGLMCVVNRLCDFRATAALVRDREKSERDGLDQAIIDSMLKPRRDQNRALGNRTWSLFWAQTITFGLGTFFIILALTLIYWASLL